MLHGATPIPAPGDLVRARSRTYLFEAVAKCPGLSGYPMTVK